MVYLLGDFLAKQTILLDKQSTANKVNCSSLLRVTQTSSSLRQVWNAWTDWCESNSAKPEQAGHHSGYGFKAIHEDKRKFSHLSAAELTMIRNNTFFFIVILLNGCVKITRDIKEGGKGFLSDA